MCTLSPVTSLCRTENGTKWSSTRPARGSHRPVGSLPWMDSRPDPAWRQLAAQTSSTSPPCGWRRTTPAVWARCGSVGFIYRFPEAWRKRRRKRHSSSELAGWRSLSWGAPAPSCVFPSRARTTARARTSSISLTANVPRDGRANAARRT